MQFELMLGEYEDGQSLGCFDTRDEALIALGTYALEHPGESLHPSIIEVIHVCNGAGCTEIAIYESWNVTTPAVRFRFCTGCQVRAAKQADAAGVTIATVQLP